MSAFLHHTTPRSPSIMTAPRKEQNPVPALASHTSSSITKMLLIGDSGAGKTGALASLASAGYNLRIIDTDAGLDVLANLLRDPKSGYKPEALGRIHYETVTDKMRPVAGRLVPGKATVWERVINLLQGKDGFSSFGPLDTWTSQDILVLDSLTTISKAALNRVLSMNGRLGQKPHQSDWYDGQQLVEGLLEQLYDDAIVCNVIVISHITFIGEDNGPQHGYPSTLGKALPPKVGRYFNTTLYMQKSGFGTNVQQKIFTRPIGPVEVKNTAPSSVRPDYPIHSGLADYFAAIRTLEPPATAASLATQKKT